MATEPIILPTPSLAGDVPAFTILLARNGQTEERAFTPARYCMATKKWFSGIRERCCRSLGRPVDGDLTVGEIMEFALGDSDELNGMMPVAYDGRHDDVDWFRDVDPESVEVAVAYFFITTVGARFKKSDASATSSDNTAPAAAAAASGTRASRTKKRPGR
jgi:hypothetical protein